MSFHLPDPSKIIHKIEHAATGGVDQVTHAVGGGINSLKHEAEGGINSLKHEAEGGIGRLKHETEGGVNRLRHEATNAAMEAVNKAIEGIEAIVSTKGFEIAVDVIELVEPDTYGLMLGIDVGVFNFGLELELANPMAKLTEIRGYIQSPPHNRETIIACVQTLGPQSLTVTATVLGNGGKVAWSGDEKYAKLNSLLQRNGVN